MAMMEYRLKEGVIDPSGALTTNIAMVQALRTQLVQQQADLAALLSQQQKSQQSDGADPAFARCRDEGAARQDRKRGFQGSRGNRVLTELVDATSSSIWKGSTPRELWWRPSKPLIKREPMQRRSICI